MKVAKELLTFVKEVVLDILPESILVSGAYKKESKRQCVHDIHGTPHQVRGRIVTKQDLMTFLAESCDCAKVTMNPSTGEILIRIPRHQKRFVKTGLGRLMPFGPAMTVNALDDWECKIWKASGEDLFIYEEGECKE
ncbi:MAG: hypothetical protein KAS32_09990 [Candidatus Peribacteraceae bacterium]|nr:hypothetical protein [Candidatus Peribacteraceae bacterium]